MKNPNLVHEKPIDINLPFLIIFQVQSCQPISGRDNDLNPINKPNTSEETTPHFLPAGWTYKDPKGTGGKIIWRRPDDYRIY